MKISVGNLIAIISVLAFCLLSIAGALWKVSGAMSTFAEFAKNSAEDRRRIWRHIDEHDKWHMERLDVGVDRRR